jgi:mono/diheme cytochrome c family protein
MPKWLLTVVVIFACLSFVPITQVYLKRSHTSPVPRTSIIPDMDNQPRWKTQMYYPLFADNRVSRPPVEGTIARGMLHDDEHLTLGISNGSWARDFPASVTVDAALLERGHKNFEIYCSMCHGSDGYGQGTVTQRVDAIKMDNKKGALGFTWIAPLDYHSDEIRSRPVGHIFNTITNGARTMPAYGSQISAADRWAIVAYVRALQLSQHVPLEDLPADQRQTLLSSSAVPAGDSELLADEAVPAPGSEPSSDPVTAPEASDNAEEAAGLAAGETDSESGDATE